MFTGDLQLSRREILADEVRSILAGGVTPCVNPSHRATLVAMKERFGLTVEVPETPPRVSLTQGDRLVVMTVRGLPRLTDRHEYTMEEVNGAKFTFAIWTVQ